MFDAIKQGVPSISIHVPLRGGRLIRICMFSAFLQFQSTSPYAGDDRTYTCGRNTRKISIHVPLRGGRHLKDKLFDEKYKISIHVPLRGGRRGGSMSAVIDFLFQSTSPYAGDDLLTLVNLLLFPIFQSTSPYAGDDRWFDVCCC